MTATDDYTRLIQRCREAAASQRNDWPGLPISHLIVGTDEERLAAALRDGAIALVERPKKVNPQATTTYLVATRP